jgi:hypothetical protein
VNSFLVSGGQEHIQFNYSLINRPKNHKTKFCPPAVHHHDSRSCCHMRKAWASRNVTPGMSAHAHAHVDKWGKFCESRHLSRGTVEMWLSKIFPLIKVTGVTLHGLRAGGLICLRNVDPRFSGLQGHWSANSQTQILYARVNALKRLEYCSRAKILFD